MMEESELEARKAKRAKMFEDFKVEVGEEVLGQDIEMADILNIAKDVVENMMVVAESNGESDEKINALKRWSSLFNEDKEFLKENSWVLYLEEKDLIRRLDELNIEKKTRKMVMDIFKDNGGKK